MATESVPKQLLQLQAIFNNSRALQGMNIDHVESLLEQTERLIERTRQEFEICMKIANEDLYDQRCDMFRPELEKGIGEIIPPNTGAMEDVIRIRVMLEETIDLIREKISS
jgi:hypothetical protein